VLSAKSAQVVRRNSAILPAYSFVLGLIALLGYMAIARGISPTNANFAVPDLFLNVFPSWFVGIAFGAIAIGALVPAAVMSIAAANLFTRNVWKEYVHRDADHEEEARVAKLTSLVVKIGALLIIILAPVKYAIDFQLLGGVWIIQTLPAVIVGLYSRWFHRWALVCGWACGMTFGTIMAAANAWASVTTVFGIKCYTAFSALILNLVVSVGLTLILRATGARDELDETRPEDFDELAEGAPAHRFEREPTPVESA
jgi:SSS family solute:Na+ symporter